MTELMNVIQSRRSTRAYTTQQVPQALVDQILEAGTWAPSANGKQGWHFTALCNPETIQILARAVAAADNRGSEYTLFGAPTFIIVSCPRENGNAFLDGGAAMQNMMLMAEGLGLGTCWINQVRVTCEHAAVRALLRGYGVPDDHIVVASLTLGYIDKPTPAKPRRDGLITIVR